MIGRSAVERMKTRNFYMILILAVVSTISLWILSMSSTSLQTIVSKTHSGIKRASSNIQIAEPALTVDPVYLRLLGLTLSRSAESPSESSSPQKLASSSSGLANKVTTNASIPVVATAAQPDKFNEVAALMHSVQSLLPTITTIVYDLGLSVTEKILLKKHCNSSWSCEVVLFAFEKYPSHIKNLNIKSYRPLCIQETLKRFGAVIWVDDGLYFTSGNLTRVMTQALKSGIQGWPLKDPTSAFTHPKMFEFFETAQKDYYFKHAVESSHLVIYNSEHVARNLMLPWVKCALLQMCIDPPGAQDTGCNYFRKPLFRYTGCHRYDMSALSIILGQMFELDETPYVYKERLFGSLVEDQMKAENKTPPQYQQRLAIGEQIKM